MFLSLVEYLRRYEYQGSVEYLASSEEPWRGEGFSDRIVWYCPLCADKEMQINWRCHFTMPLLHRLRLFVRLILMRRASQPGGNSNDYLTNYQWQKKNKIRGAFELHPCFTQMSIISYISGDCQHFVGQLL